MTVRHWFRKLVGRKPSRQARRAPHKFFARECAKLGFTLPEPGEYGVGMVFLPVEKHQRLQCEGILERIAREEGLTVLGWRDTPIDQRTKPVFPDQMLKYSKARGHCLALKDGRQNGSILLLE